MSVLTTCQPAGGSADQTLGACPRWISSGGSPAQRCSVQQECHSVSAPLTLNTPQVNPDADTHPPACVYLVEGCQVVSGFNEKRLVDSRVIHVMSCCCHQTQEHIQRSQLLRQLQNTNDLRISKRDPCEKSN